MAIFETMKAFWDFTDEKNSIQQVSIVETPPSAIRFAAQCECAEHSAVRLFIFFFPSQNYPLCGHQAEHTIEKEEK